MKKPKIGNITYNQYYKTAINNLKANLNNQGVK